MLRYAFGLTALAIAGAVVAIVAMGVHRAQPYLGVCIAIAMTLSTAVFARTWRRYAGLAAFAVGWLALTMVLIYVPGPGGNVVFLEDTVGLVWIYGGSLALVAVALVPRAVLEGGSGVASEA